MAAALSTTSGVATIIAVAATGVATIAVSTPMAASVTSAVSAAISTPIPATIASLGLGLGVFELEGSQIERQRLQANG